MKYFEAFGESGYHSAFMTTYAFGAQAFEDVPFPRLRGAGCRNIIVLADRQMLNQAFSEFGPPRFAGSSYHIVKAVAPGAFHPKITMLVGASKGRLMIGSANLTALGLGGNKELVASIHYNPDLPDHARHFASVLTYIESYVPTDDPWFSTGLQRALRRSPWLRPANGSPTPEGDSELAILLDRRDTTLLDQIVALIGADRIQRLIIISPYWDTKFDGLARLRSALGTPETDLLVDRSRTGFPKQELRRFSGVELFDIGGDPNERFVHAKLIVAQGAAWDHVISGSMNCTFPALMGLSSFGGNAEAGVYRRMPRGTALEALGLSAYQKSPLQVSSISEMANLASSNTDDGKYVDGGTLTLQSGRLSWNPPSSLALEAIALTLFTHKGERVDGNIDLHTSPARSWQRNAEGVRPKYGHVSFSDGSISAPIQIIDVDVLTVATMPPQRGRKKQLIEALAETLYEDLALIEALNQLVALEAEEDGAANEKPADATRSASKAASPQDYKVLSYEEFIRARSFAAREESAARGYLHHQQDSGANMLSACLNRLIGLVSRDLGADEDRDLQAIEAIDFTTTEQQAPSDTDGLPKANDTSSQVRSEGAEAKTTAKKIQDAVTAFEDRCRSLKNMPIRTAEIVRLRALIQIILSYAQNTQGISSSTQILPVYTTQGYDWPRLVGRLLLQHFGTSRALQQLHVKPDEGEQQRVIEYMALANWAAQASLFAVKSVRDAKSLRAPMERLMNSLETQTQTVISIVPGDKEYFDQVSVKLNERFGSRLGFNGAK